MGCAALAIPPSTDLGACRLVGTTTSPAGVRYTSWICTDGTIILRPYDACRDDPNSNCKEI
jgi:hypothetical protein